MPDSLYNGSVVLAGLATCIVGLIGIGLLVTYLRRERACRKFVEVGVVSHLYIHPIKSCRGLEVSQADCAMFGLESDGLMDRSFIILNDQNKMVTGRTYPSIALITPSLSNDKQSLLVDAPGMPTLTLPLRTQQEQVIDLRVWGLAVQGEDCGREAGEWLSQFLGSPGFKFVRHSERLQGKLLREDPKWGIHMNPQDRALYQDLGQVHILGAASLDDLNSRLEKPVQMGNFRPNIVVEGSSAYAEDKWKYIHIGDQAVIRKTHCCGRCLQTTVDTDTGKFIENGEPLKTLKKFRMASPDDPDKDRHGSAPLLGILLAIEQHGTIRVGDVVFASREP